MARMYTEVEEVYVNGLGWVSFKALDVCLRVKLHKEDKITRVKLNYIDCSNGVICGDGIEELSIDSDIRRYEVYICNEDNIKINEVEFFCKVEDKLEIIKYINNQYNDNKYGFHCLCHGSLSTYVNIKLKIESL